MFRIDVPASPVSGDNADNGVAPVLILMVPVYVNVVGLVKVPPVLIFIVPALVEVLAGAKVPLIFIVPVVVEFVITTFGKVPLSKRNVPLAATVTVPTLGILAPVDSKIPLVIVVPP